MIKPKVINLVLITVLLLTVMALPVLTGCGSKDAEPTPTTQPETPAKVYTFEYNCPLPPGGWSEEWQQKYVDDVKRLTNGQVVINLRIGGPLGPPSDGINMLESGVAHVIYHAPPFTPGLFPLSDVCGMPFLATNPQDVADLMYDVLAWDKTTEYDNLKVLAFLPTNPVSMFFADKKVETVADLAGLKMRGIGGSYSSTLDAMGAASVAIPTKDVYMSLDTGVIDGASTNFNYLSQIKGWEVVKYGTTNALNGGLHMVLMSKTAWDSLPSNLQKIIDDYNETYWREYLEFNVDVDQQSLKELEANGVDVYTLDDTVMAQFKQMTGSIVTDYEKSLNDKGLPGTELIAKAKKYGSR